MDSVAFLLTGYIAGSIPFGLVLAWLAGYGDIRKTGSGNIGATNVLRTGNKPLALLTLILDAGKGAAAAGAVLYFVSFDMALWAALGAIIGHCFPVWLKFKGGKGVATTLGTLLAVMPGPGLMACGVWLVTAALFRMSSLAALVALLSAPLSAFLLYGEMPALIAFLIAALVWWRHKENIRRLIKGEEPKIGKKETTNKPQ